ncbi:SdrD B-like domain-containing protein [Amycolatopsis mongoliensis]|uniref:SdrD B-like domain-containing protein n=1 Tax=Amycolatopsis mongoliensis TaxID=715475 RepID=A0A9Y2JYB6_9PSEU|nr:carboxypeptidase regulatory-like domain-containing protein [Amycolatopsis sp. 4-36]WIY06920.1 SdrD B-like domain-containing protein [Amycolatopsis sp. 4-36]
MGIRRALVTLAAVLVASVGFAVPASAADYDLRGTAAVEGGPYLPGEPVTVKYTVTNAGTRGVYYSHGIADHVGGTRFWVDSGWGDLGPGGLGASFVPGETREYRLTGHLTGSLDGDSRFRLSVSLLDGVTPPLAPVDVVVPAAAGTTTIGGQAFADADEDGVADPGEALAGVDVRLNGTETRTTDADGRYSFEDLPPGRYDVYPAGAPGGWIVGGGTSVRADGTTPVVEVPLRALRPLSETLHAEVALDKDTYRVGDPAVLTVQLANTGSRVISGVYGACDRGDIGRALDITPAGWGELDYFGPGATIRPGETRTFRVSGTVTERAGRWGVLEQICDFTRDEAYHEGTPQARDTAKILGLDGTSRGRIVTETGEGLAGQPVTATDIDTGQVLTATTDADGNLTIAGPTGRYRLSVAGPWVLVGQQWVYVVSEAMNQNGWVFTRQPG